MGNHNTFISILFLLSLTQQFVMEDSNLKYLAQSQTMSFKSSNIQNQIVNVVLKTKFEYSPKIVLGIVQIEVVKKGGFSFDIYYQTQTYFNVKGNKQYCSHQIKMNTTKQLRFYYLAFDEKKLLNFAYGTETQNMYQYHRQINNSIYYYYRQNSALNIAKLINLYQKGYYLCSITYTCLTKYAILPYILYLNCQINSTSLDVKIRINQKSTNNGYNRFLGFSILYIAQNNQTKITNGILNSYQSLTGVINYTIEDPYNIYFIGLSSLNSKNFTFDFKLIKNDLEIEFNQGINNVTFSYMYIRLSKSELSLIKSEIFKQNPILEFHFINTFNLSKQIVVSSIQTTSTQLTPHNVSQGVQSGTSIFHFNTTIYLDNSLVTISYHDKKGWISTTRSTKSIIFFIKQIDLNFLQNNLNIKITGNHILLKEKFKFQNNLKQKNIYYEINSTVFDVDYSIDNVGLNHLLIYHDQITQSKIESKFVIPQIFYFKTSVLNTQILIRIKSLPDNILPIKEENIALSTNLTNLFIRDPSIIDLIINYIFDDSNLLLSNTIRLSKNDLFKMNLKFSIPTVLSMTTFSDTSFATIQFVNIINQTKLSLSNFNVTQQGIILKKFNFNEQKNKNYLDFQYHNSSENSPFDIEIFRADSLTNIKIIDIKIHKKLISIKNNQFQNWANITLDNIDLLDQNELNGSISIKSPNFTLVNITIVDGNILLQTLYNKTIEQTYLYIEYQADKDTIYKDIIGIKMKSDFPLVYCKGLFPLQSKIYSIFSKGISVMYLLLFIIAFISYNKIMAVQTIFLAQLTFYSFLPIGMFCKPFAELIGMQYLNGMNPFFLSSQQVQISYYYSSLNLKDSFTQNINVMLFPIIISFLLYIPFRIISYFSTCYKTKPRFLRYANSCLFEVPLAILLFNSFNIYNSFVIQIQYYESSKLNQLIISILVALLIPCYWFLCCFMRKHFHEFKEEFEDKIRIFKFTLQVSYSIRLLYPLIIIFEMVAIPLLISIQKLFGIGLFIVLGIEVVIFVFILFTQLYFWGYQNIRTIAHRTIVILVCVVQIILLVFKNDYNEEDSIVYWIPLIVLIILTIAFIINGLCIFWMAYKWYIKQGVIDAKMKLQQQATLVNPKQDPFDFKSIYRHENYHGKSQHSMVYYIKTKIPNINDRTNQQVKDCIDLIQKKSYDWFNEIQIQNYFSILCLNKNDYTLQKNNLIGTYNKHNCNITFRYLSVFLSNKIVKQWQKNPDLTLLQYIDNLPDEELQSIQKINKRNGSMKPLFR